MKYVSKSKGTEVDLEDMNGAHLSNAYRARLAKPHGALDELLGYMAEELRSRGATVDGATVTWPTREGDPADERTS
jgi:hypothetical protein